MKFVISKKRKCNLSSRIYVHKIKTTAVIYLSLFSLSSQTALSNVLDNFI